MFFYSQNDDGKGGDKKDHKSLDEILGAKEAEEVKAQYEIEVAKEIAIPASYLSQLLPDVYNFVLAQYEAGNVTDFNSKIYTLKLDLTLTEPTDDPATNAIILIAQQLIEILKESGVKMLDNQKPGNNLENLTKILAGIWNSGFQQDLFSGATEVHESKDMLTQYPVITNYEIIQNFLTQTASRAAKAMVQHGYKLDPKDLT